MEETNLYNVRLLANKKGELRQAGTVDPAGDLIRQVREKAERDLYYFCVVILKRGYLTKDLHKPICDWLTTFPPVRKMLLLPRNHAKTSIVSHGLPTHILIQPVENNIYWPGIAGCDMKIALVGEVSTRAEENMSVIRSIFDNNEMFRGLWPHLCWDNPRAQAPSWNNEKLVIPRHVHFPDPSIRAVGAEAAITGTRPHVAIKDDLVAQKAANSPIVMETAIDIHKNSRALYEDQDRSLEFMIGTRWAVKDLYSWTLENDPTVEPLIRAMIEDGKLIYPEHFTWEAMEQLRETLGSMFSLMYMNNVGDPDLIDFPQSDLRFYKQIGKVLTFDSDIRDDRLIKQATPRQITEVPRGMTVNEAINAHVSGRDMYFANHRRR